MTLATFGREEFLSTRWRYRAGEHVTFLGPTGVGKTMLGLDLLRRTTHPRLPGLVLVMKPRDPVVERFAREAEYTRVRTWPPPWRPWRADPPGWVVWPRVSFDPAADDEEMERQFGTALVDSYRRGNRIVFGDEVYGLSEELGLRRPLVTLWTRGRSMGTGLWSATQKPSHIPTWAYNQAEHLFLHYDPDKRNRDRFEEIGGIESRLVQDIVMSLPKYHWLYVRRDGPAMCVIAKD